MHTTCFHGVRYCANQLRVVIELAQVRMRFEGATILCGCRAGRVELSLSELVLVTKERQAGMSSGGWDFFGSLLARTSVDFSESEEGKSIKTFVQLVGAARRKQAVAGRSPTCIEGMKVAWADVGVYRPQHKAKGLGGILSGWHRFQVVLSPR